MTIRKISAAILALSLSLGLCGISHAMETVTLSQLKQTAPQRLAFLCQVNGETVEVDAPIILPEGDTLPILQVNWLPVNSLAIDETFGKFGTFLTGTGYEASENDPHGIWINPYNEDFNPLTGKISQMTIPKKEEGRLDAVWKYTLEAYPENNPLPPDRPLAKMGEVLEVAGIADKVDVRLIAQAATRRPLKSKMVRKVSPEHPEWGEQMFWDVNEKKPFKSRDMGRYELEFGQYMRGVRIFPDIYYPLPPSRTPNPKDGDFARHGILMQMIAEDDFFVDAEFFEETAVLVDDAPLASLEAVQAAIQKRMESGELRKVVKLELGYIVRVDGPSHIYPFEATSFALTPVWSIIGEDSKNDYRSQSFRRRHVEDFRYDFYPFSSDNFDLRMDAETAEFILDGGWAWYPRKEI